MRKVKLLILSLMGAGLLSFGTGCVVKSTTTREPVAYSDENAPPATEKRHDVEVKPAVPHFHED